MANESQDMHDLPDGLSQALTNTHEPDLHVWSDW